MLSWNYLEVVSDYELVFPCDILCNVQCFTLIVLTLKGRTNEYLKFYMSYCMYILLRHKHTSEHSIDKSVTLYHTLFILLRKTQQLILSVLSSTNAYLVSKLKFQSHRYIQIIY